MICNSTKFSLFQSALGTGSTPALDMTTLEAHFLTSLSCFHLYYISNKDIEEIQMSQMGNWNQDYIWAQDV